MAFENFIGALGDLDYVAVIDTRNAHPDERRDRQANACRIDLGSIAADDLRILKFTDAFDDGRRRQPDLAAELGVAHTSVFLQDLNELPIDLIKHSVHILK